MFEALARAIDELEIAPQSEAVVELARAHAVLDAKLTLALGGVDASGEWALDGSASMTAWVRTHLGWSNRHANGVLRTARRLRDLPVTSQAWVDGRLLPGQVEVVVANVTDRRAGLWADHEAELVPLLEPLDVTGTATALQDWAAKADAILEDPALPAEPPAQVRFARTLDGRGYLQGSLDGEAAEVVATGLRLADSGDFEVPAAQRQGQALVDVFRWFLDHQHTHLGRRHRPHLNVVIDHHALVEGGPGRVLGGPPLPGLVVDKLACDATIHRVLTDGTSSILDYGRGTRTIPPALYTALVLRDWGCRYPGCDRPAAWCDGHHVVHWRDGGPTQLSNLALLCSRHHHVIHQPGWHLRLHPTGTVEVTDPQGRRRTSDPPRHAAAA